MLTRVTPRTAALAPVLASLAMAAALLAPLGQSQPVGAQAAPQGQNRAAVIVHTGGGSRAVCVRFDEAAISGIVALQRAGLGAVIRSFSGQGAAVCGINGTGCPADDSCLTCQAPNYWAYHRAGPGAGGFSFSSAGASGTQVTDGSVEGWQWGTGAAPPFQTVDQVCGASTPSPPPTAAPAPSPSPGGPSDASGSGTPSGGAADEAGVPVPDFRGVTTTTVVTTTTGPSTTATTAPPNPASGDEGVSDSDTEVAGDLAAASGPSDDDGSPWVMGLFGLLVLGLGAAAVVIRRRRTI